MFLKTMITVAAISGLSVQSHGKHVFAGSDTLAGVMTDAIIASGLDQQITYIGGGSGNGEKAIANGEQGIAPMSREVKPEILAQINAQGVTLVPHIIALDGIAIFANKANMTQGLDIGMIRKIFSCEVTQWENVPGSSLRGVITVYRRNDASGTTDTIKHLAGIKKFGACVVVMNETADIAEKTSKEVSAIAYAGLSGKTEHNRVINVSKEGTTNFVTPTAATVRDGSYPLARKLYVYEVTGARTINKVESQLVEFILDRSFIDPIIQEHEFFTID
jgi:phosphate transport system substrate-binding protein